MIFFFKSELVWYKHCLLVCCLQSTHSEASFLNQTSSQNQSTSIRMEVGASRAVTNKRLLLVLGHVGLGLPFFSSSCPPQGQLGGSSSSLNRLRLS